MWSQHYVLRGFVYSVAVHVYLVHGVLRLFVRVVLLSAQKHRHIKSLLILYRNIHRHDVLSISSTLPYGKPQDYKNDNLTPKVVAEKPTRDH